jgi:hypothetical protein
MLNEKRPIRCFDETWLTRTAILNEENTVEFLRSPCQSACFWLLRSSSVQPREERKGEKTGRTCQFVAGYSEEGNGRVRRIRSRFGIQRFPKRAGESLPTTYRPSRPAPAAAAPAALRPRKRLLNNYPEPAQNPPAAGLRRPRPQVQQRCSPTAADSSPSVGFVCVNCDLLEFIQMSGQN